MSQAEWPLTNVTLPPNTPDIVRKTNVKIKFRDASPPDNTPIHLKHWWQMVHSSLERREEPVQDAAAVACAALTKYCWDKASKEKMEVLPLFYFAEDFIEKLQPTKGLIVRRGYASAAGKLPKEMTREYAEALVKPLVEMVTVIRKKDAAGPGGPATDAETRRNAVGGLTGLVLGLGVQEFKNAVSKALFDDIVEALFVGMEDYSIDNRGDVGSWVRESCFVSWTRLLPFVIKLEDAAVKNGGGNADRYITSKIVTRVLTLLARQAVEKIDRVRQTAGEALANLIWDDTVMQSPEATPQPPELLHALQNAVKSVNFVNWINPADVFTRMIQLLDVPEARLEVLLGLVVSVGGITESLVRHSTSCFVEYVNSLPVDKASSGETTGTKTTLLDILDSYLALFTYIPAAQKDRVSSPLLEVADLLIGSGALAKAVDSGSWVDGAARFFESIKGEVVGSKDVKKLTAGLKV
jgi:hypothetical protein